LSDIEDQFQPYFTLFGWFMHSWSQIERCLDVYVAIAWNRCGGDGLKLEYPKRALGRKIKYLQRAVALGSVAPYRDRLVAVMDRCVALTDFRHLLTHGSVESLGEQGATIVKLDIDPKDWRFVETTAFVAWDTFQSMGIAAEELATAALALSSDLFAQFEENGVK
jgi:hypothetical protein